MAPPITALKLKSSRPPSVPTSTTAQELQKKGKGLMAKIQVGSIKGRMNYVQEDTAFSSEQIPVQVSVL